MKIIEVIADAGHEDTIRGIAEQHLAEDLWFSTVNEDGRIETRNAVQSRTLSIVFWISLLLVIALTIYLRQHV